MFTRLLFAITFLAFTLSANAAGSKNNLYADDLPVLPKNARILLLPLYDNNHFQGGEGDTLFTQLKTQLSGLGHKLDTPTFELMVGEEFAPTFNQNYSLLLSEHIRNTQMKADAKSEFAKGIQYIGDIVILPSITMREAKLDGETARWDNSHHVLRLLGTSSEWRWTGGISGLSLKLEAYSKEGQWLFTSYGAVSLPVSADVTTRKFVRKENIFEHKKDVKGMERGVKKAIYPIKKRLKL